MPLTFDDRSLLPLGIHDATLDEVETCFGRFQKTDRRMKLFAKLKTYVQEVRRTGWECSIIIDGSFVMPSVDEPEDVDVILVMPSDWDITSDLKPYQYNVVSKRYTKKEYGVEVYPVVPGTEAEERAKVLFHRVRVEWCRQFGWPVDSMKGIVRIVP